MARTATTVVVAVGLMAVAGGCGAESSVDEASTAATAGSAAASAAPEVSGRGDTSPGQTNPPLPPPTPEPDNEAVEAALLGMSQADAESKAIAAGYTIRIASVDGEGRAMTMDYRFDRINLELEGGLVTRAYVA